MPETSGNLARNRVHFVVGTPAAVANRVGFDAIQAFRNEALYNARGYRRVRDVAQVARFVKRTSEAVWNNPNLDPDMTPGQHRWNPRVAVALAVPDDAESTADATTPLAYWYTARNASSRAERLLAERGHRGAVAATLGAVERGMKQRTHVWTKEYAALPGREKLTPQVGAIVLDTYPKHLPGTIFPISEDSDAKTCELLQFGFEPDGSPPTRIENLFGSLQFATEQERWVVSSMRKAIANLQLHGGFTEIPPAELLTA